MDTLVLNSAWLPIDCISWTDAIGDLLTGRAEVVETYEHTISSGPNVLDLPRTFEALKTGKVGVWKVPSVIRFLTKAVFFRRRVKFNRHNVWLRDKGRCFGEGTRILMADGSQKPIERVQEGDRVIDAFGDAQAVVTTGRRLAGNAVLIRHRGSAEETLTTADHPFRDSKGDWTLIGDQPEYLTFPRQIQYELPVTASVDVAGLLSDDQWLRLRNGRVYYSRRSTEVGIPTTLKVTPELARIAGLFAAEGTASCGKGLTRLSFAFHRNEEATLGKAVVGFFEGLGFRPGTQNPPGRNTHIVRVAGKGLAILFHRLCGVGAGKKTPWQLIGPYHAAYLRGLFEGDAYFRHDDGKVALFLIAEDLIFGAQSMLWGLGIYPTVQLIHRIGRQPAWGLVLNAENYTKFMRSVMQQATPDRTPIFGDDDFVYRKLKTVTPVEGETLVYNFETTGSHSYIANGLAVHNCQYCNVRMSSDEFTYDHIVPFSKGGTTKWRNIVVACVPCNHKKANRTPREAGMRLRRKPFIPMHLPGQVSPALKWHEGMPPSWKSFLASVSYWHGKLD